MRWLSLLSPSPKCSSKKLTVKTGLKLGGTGGLGNNRSSGCHSNYRIVKNTEKSPGDLRKLGVSQTPVRNHRLKLIWNTRKGVTTTTIIIIILIEKYSHDSFQKGLRFGLVNLHNRMTENVQNIWESHRKPESVIIVQRENPSGDKNPRGILGGDLLSSLILVTVRMSLSYILRKYIGGKNGQN